MKGRHIAYLPEELAWIEARKELPRAELHQMFIAYWRRPEISLTNLNALCKRKGWITGRTGRIEKGAVPPNKGKKGICAPGSEKGWFRKGSRSGRAAENYKPIGTERINEDGYIERKIHDGLPMQSRWRMLHLLNWEALHGPVPAGMCLKSRDGNRQNTDPSNWEPIDRALLPVLNGGKWGKLGYDEAAVEVKPALMALAKLRIAKRDAKRRSAK